MDEASDVSIGDAASVFEGRGNSGTVDGAAVVSAGWSVKVITVGAGASVTGAESPVAVGTGRLTSWLEP